MATFIAKQLVGKQLESVKGALGDKADNNSENKSEVDPEVEAAIREAEEKRLDKHRKLEEERENMRQGIRDKYGLKKKEDPMMDELAMGDDSGKFKSRNKPVDGEASEEENIFDNVKGFVTKVTDVPKQMITEASEKCLLM